MKEESGNQSSAFIGDEETKSLPKTAEQLSFMEQPYSGQKRKLGKPVVYELSSSSSAKSYDSFNGKRKKSIVLDQFTGEKIKQTADKGHE